MALISVTRLRLRRRRFLPGVVLDSWWSARSARRTAGFLGGYLGTSPPLTFWTVTLWENEQAMHAFRRSPEHLRAMPRLARWCDEAAVVHWHAEAQVPTPAEVALRLRDEGRTSRLSYPTPEHVEGLTWPDARLPRPGAPLRPKVAPKAG